MTKIVLIVDDEEIIVQTILRRILLQKSDDLQPLIAIDGFEALEFMRKKNVAAVILDLKMNNMDGVSVCRAAHADHALRSIPIIISSGHIADDVREHLESLGVKFFLNKPYSMDQLMQILDSILDCTKESI